MTKTKQELGQKQLDDFLEEIGVLPSSQAVDTESSLENLVKEIFELTQDHVPPPATPSLPILPLERELIKRRSKSMIWITATLLIGLIVGAACGFFWAKSTGLLEKPIVESQEGISSQISYWIEELNTLYDKVDPIKPPSEEETLAPSELSIRNELKPNF